MWSINRLSRRVIQVAPSWYRRVVSARHQVTQAIMKQGELRQRSEVVMASTASLAVKALTYRATLYLLERGDLADALRFGEAYLPVVEAAPAAAASYAALLKRQGGIVRPLQILQATTANEALKLVATLRRHNQLLNDGVVFSTPARVPRPVYQPVDRRILYYVASSMPYHSTGYAVRTHALAQALQARGWEMHVVARAGYPNDRWDYPKVQLADAAVTIDGVAYHFAPANAKLQYVRDIQRYHDASVARLVQWCKELRPAVIHAASNYNCGLAAVDAGWRLGIPVIYEVRGLWHVTKTAADPAYLDSDHYRMVEHLEVQAAKHADMALTITSGVAHLLERHGVVADKLAALPNAVDPQAFLPLAPDEALQTQYGLRGHLVIGYVGSLLTYEGLDDLIVAAECLRQAVVPPFKVLIVGDGEMLPDLQLEAAKRGLAETVLFVGRVPFVEARRYYSVIDIVVVPRKPTLVCELISPMKPFEAMAMEKALVVSDVAALADIVRHGETGLLFAKGNTTALAATLARLLNDGALRGELGLRAGRWVRANRTWEALASGVDAIYRRLS